MSDQNTDNRSHGNGNHQTEETEQNTAGQQGKHYPYRMQTDIVSDQFRGKKIALDKLSAEKNGHNLQDRRPRIKLCKSNG